MQHLLNILLVFYILLKPLAPMIDYALHYDYIANNLCVNKNRPQLSCNGKCYLKKEIEKNHDQSSKNESSKSVINLDTFLIYEVFTMANHSSISTSAVVNTLHPSFYLYDYYASVFHPPLVQINFHI